MEIHRQGGLTATPGRWRGRLLGAIIGGGLLGALATIVLGFAVDFAGALAGSAAAGLAYRRVLAAGGWTWLPLYGAAAGLWFTARSAPPATPRLAMRATAILLALLPLVWHPFVPGDPQHALPATPAAKIRAIPRYSYRSLEDVARIVALSRDPDAAVRAHAVQALGVNLVVTDIEHDRPGFPSRYHADPMRDRLRTRLLETLTGDSVEAVRAEAAHALWKAPRTFGAQPTAAESLAAILVRTAGAASPGRPAWLAIDAFTAWPDSTLRAATVRFATVSADTALVGLARRALARPDGRRDAPHDTGAS